MTGKIHWRCFHCGDAFTLAQRKHAEAHFGAEQSTLPVCQMRLPGEHHLLNILRKMEGELRAFYAEDTELWRALYAQAADHAQALRNEEERGYAKGLADGRAHPAENSAGVSRMTRHGNLPPAEPHDTSTKGGV